MQKSVRRGLVKESTFWALELYWTCGRPIPKAKASHTNAWNRMLVMAVEDIGLADPSVLLKIYDLMGTKDSEDDLLNGIKILAESPKSRINDWMIHVPCIKDKKVKRKYKEYRSVERLISECISSLKKGDRDRCMKYERIASLCGKEVGMRGESKYTLLIKGIKKVIERECGDSHYLEVCKSICSLPSWKKSDKSRIIIYHVLNMYFNGMFSDKSIRKGKYKIEYKDYTKTIKKRNIYYDMPYYALDKHTRRGKRLIRKSGYGEYAIFLDIGSVIYNIPDDLKEEEDRLREEFREIYCD